MTGCSRSCARRRESTRPASCANPCAASFAAEGVEYATPRDRPTAWLVVLSESPAPIGPTLIEGRTFDSSDNATGLKTAIVSRALAGEQWPGKSPLGETIEVAIGDSATEQRVIVGVVGDIAFDPVGMTAAGNSAIYIPMPQRILPASRAIVRHFGEEAAARSAMYEALARIDPTLAPNIQTYETAIEPAHAVLEDDHEAVRRLRRFRDPAGDHRHLRHEQQCGRASNA